MVYIQVMNKVIGYGLEPKLICSVSLTIRNYISHHGPYLYCTLLITRPPAAGCRPSVVVVVIVVSPTRVCVPCTTPTLRRGVFIGIGLMWARKLRRRRLKWERRRAMTSLDVVRGDVFDVDDINEGMGEGDVVGGGGSSSFQPAAMEEEDHYASFGGPDSGFVAFDRATDRIENAAQTFMDSVWATKLRIFGGGNGGGGGGGGGGGARGGFTQLA